MKDVKQYDYVCGQYDSSGHSYYGMVERPEGKFVLAEDYDALKAEQPATHSEDGRFPVHGNGLPLIPAAPEDKSHE